MGNARAAARRAIVAMAAGMALAAGAARGQAPVPVEALPAVEVRAAPLGDDAPGQTRPGTRLRGDALRERIGGTLGETIGEEAGVSNSSFGPGVGLPVIRGLGGSRVRILSNGGNSHDASWISPDHATSADPLLADEVRVLRGPATIRYGGGAIGGAVDVIDGRIPWRRPARPIAGAAEARYDFNGAGRTGAFRVDGGNRRFGFHADAFARRRNDIDIPGCAVDDAAVRQQFGLINLRNTCGFVGNSDARSEGGSVGGSVFSDIGLVGASYSVRENNYGIPPSAGSHGGGDEQVRIDLENRRADGRIELWGNGSWIDLVRMDLASVRYRHDEVENGQIGTTFRNIADDVRLEVEHSFGERVSGLFGGQFLDRNFSAQGAEAFIPSTDTRMWSLYLVERVALGPVELEGGWRRESLDVTAGPQRTVDRRILNFPATSFQAESYLAAATWRFAQRASLRGMYSSAARAPEVQELYSFGPHLATRTFDVGNSLLKVERIESLDATLDADAGWMRLSATVFRNDASNFIFQRSAGNIFFDAEEGRFRARCVRLEECLPVSRYEQSDARFTGYEAEVAFRLDTAATGPFELAFFGDYVDGRLTTRDEAVPRLPPRRVGVQIAKAGPGWSARVRYTRVSAQNDPGANETPTAGYDLLNAYVSYTPKWSGRLAPVIFARVRNLLDEEIRNATSFLRSYSPEPGRSLEVGLRLNF